MPRFERDLRVSVEVDATPDAVWELLEPIERHVDWMADARSIRFLSETTRGVGTRFVCDTRVGPFRATDQAEVVAWVPGVELTVRHLGTVTGLGSITLAPIDLDRRTRIVWTESLSFPWWMGGPIGAWCAARVMTRVLGGNLQRFRRMIDACPA